jgi:hypothetical protein
MPGNDRLEGSAVMLDDALGTLLFLLVYGAVLLIPAGLLYWLVRFAVRDSRASRDA